MVRPIGQDYNSFAAPSFFDDDGGPLSLLETLGVVGAVEVWPRNRTVGFATRRGGDHRVARQRGRYQGPAGAGGSTRPAARRRRPT